MNRKIGKKLGQTLQRSRHARLYQIRACNIYSLLNLLSLLLFQRRVIALFDDLDIVKCIKVRI